MKHKPLSLLEVMKENRKKEKALKEQRKNEPLPQVQYEPLCPNKNCDSFNSAKKLKKHDSRENKSTGETYQRYRCLDCGSIITSKPSSPFKNPDLYQNLRLLDVNLSYEQLARKYKISSNTAIHMLDRLKKGRLFIQEINFQIASTHYDIKEIPITTNKNFQSSVIILFGGLEIEAIYAFDESKKTKKNQFFKVLKKMYVDHKEQLQITSPYKYRGIIQLKPPEIVPKYDESTSRNSKIVWDAVKIIHLSPEALDHLSEAGNEIRKLKKFIKNKNNLTAEDVEQLKNIIHIPRSVLTDLNKNTKTNRSLTLDHLKKIEQSFYISKKDLENVKKLVSLTSQDIKRIEETIINDPFALKLVKRLAKTDTDYFHRACGELNFFKLTKAKNIKELSMNMVLFSILYNNWLKKIL